MRHRERVVGGLRVARARRRRRTSGSRRPTRSGTGPRARAAGRGRCAAGRAPRTSSSTRRRRSSTRSPGSAPTRWRRPPQPRLGDRNLATGDSNEPSAATFSHTRPLAPSALARSVSLSSWLRPYSAAAPGTRIPLIAAAPANALNSVAANTSVSSTSSMPKRRSGLSTPKRSIASCHVIRSISGGRSPVTASAAASTASLIAAEHVVLGRRSSSRRRAA